MSDQQEVLLTVPAMPEFLRVARVTASGLASRLGFGLDDVDDLRLALDELCFAIIGKGSDNMSLSLRYSMTDAVLSIEGSTPIPAKEPLGVGELSRQILTALVDDHRVWQSDGKSCFSLTKSQAA